MPWQDIQKIRQASPLVHNITNYVVMNTTANALLALGASPVMSHAPEEVEEMVANARALVLNIGTLSENWIAAMFRAGEVAKRAGIPIILDPVGCGATGFRTRTARRLVEHLQPTVIRGNASEIQSLVEAGRNMKGVDSLCTPDQVKDAAIQLAQAFDCVVSVSGPIDLVIDRTNTLSIANGHPVMPRVTGMGCTASALTGAFLAVNPSALNAAANAMATMGIAGEIAAERSAGPGSFQVNFIDALFNLDEATLNGRLKIGLR